MPITPGSQDPRGFNDDETEAWREMHQTRIQFSAKLGCLGYIIFLIVVVIVCIIEKTFGN